MTDLWTAFDLPVLEAVVDLCNNDQFSDCNDTQVEQHTGFSQATVQASLRRLREAQPPVASFEEMGGRIMKIHHPTEEAFRRVKVWPNPVEDHAAALVAILQALADRTDDVNKKAAIEHTADIVKEIPKSVIGEVVGGFMKGILGTT